MTEEQLKITTRALTNILMSMIKAEDAPASAEMHLIESVADLSRMLNIKDFKDSEMQDKLSYCTEIIDSVRHDR